EVAAQLLRRGRQHGGRRLLGVLGRVGGGAGRRVVRDRQFLADVDAVRVVDLGAVRRVDPRPAARVAVELRRDLGQRVARADRVGPALRLGGLLDQGGGLGLLGHGGGLDGRLHLGVCRLRQLNQRAGDRHRGGGLACLLGYLLYLRRGGVPARSSDLARAAVQVRRIHRTPQVGSRPRTRPGG